MSHLTPDDASSDKKGYLARVQKFEIIYGLYEQPILRYLLEWVYDKEHAADLCQDTFVLLWNFLLSQVTISQQIAYYKNWLYKTAKYRAIDYLRRKKPIGYLSMLENEAYTQLPELMVEGHENRICDGLWLQEKVAQLPMKYREPLLLKYHDGYSQKEIAAKKGISEAAVSINVSHAKAQLKRKCYPVAHSLEREILSWRQDVEKLSLGLIEDMRLVRGVLPGDELPYELRQRVGLSLVESINCERSLVDNIWVKLGIKDDRRLSKADPRLIEVVDAGEGICTGIVAACACVLARKQVIIVTPSSKMIVIT